MKHTIDFSFMDTPIFIQFTPQTYLWCLEQPWSWLNMGILSNNHYCQGKKSPKTCELRTNVQALKLVIMSSNSSIKLTGNASYICQFCSPTKHTSHLNPHHHIVVCHILIFDAWFFSGVAQKIKKTVVISWLLSEEEAFVAVQHWTGTSSLVRMGSWRPWWPWRVLRNCWDLNGISWDLVGFNFMGI